MSDFTAAVSEMAMPALASNRECEQAALGVSDRELNRPADHDPRMKRYTLVIEPAAHPEARREVIVKARDDGDAYDQAADHAAAELPYRCTIAIAKIEEIVEGPLHQPPLATPAETDADLLSFRLPGRLLPPRVNAMTSLTRQPQPLVLERGRCRKSSFPRLNGGISGDIPWESFDLP